MPLLLSYADGFLAAETGNMISGGRELTSARKTGKIRKYVFQEDDIQKQKKNFPGQQKSNFVERNKEKLSPSYCKKTVELSKLATTKYWAMGEKYLWIADISVSDVCLPFFFFFLISILIEKSSQTPSPNQ